MTQFSIFKVKPELEKRDDIVAAKRGVWSEGIRFADDSIGILYVSSPEPKPPAWISLFPTVDFTGRQPRTASASAVLLIRRSAGYFAVVFGFGRYLLKESVIDERFGLRVALNAMDATQLRTLDHKRLDAVPRHTREQLSKGGALGQFGLDIERDLLRGLTASPADAALGKVITGADALNVSGDISLDQLPDLLDKYERLAGADDYKKVFPWVDNIAAIHDRRLVEKLESRLVDEMKTGSSLVWLAVPELVDWSNVAGFKFTRSAVAEQRDALDLASYYLDCGSRTDMSAGRLKTDIVRCIRADDGADWHRWPVSRCIVAEISEGGETFVLSEGLWFRVSRAFLQEVDDAIRNITRLYPELPPYVSGDERTYNKRAARKSAGTLHMLDGDFITHGGRGSIEVCDLYSRDRIFVHVKRYGASSVLSHLFAQGAVSGDLFYGDASFRKAVSDKLPVPYRWGDPAQPPIAQQFEICFAVICRPGRPLELPFFSKVNLRKEAKRLQQLGFKVSLVGIAA